jgi:hypothetical protein
MPTKVDRSDHPHADRARPVPDRLIVLDRVDLISGENTAL